MCSCGCNTCETKNPILNEVILKQRLLSEGLLYHVKNERPIYNNIYRYGSEKYLELFKEVRHLYSRGLITLNTTDEEIITETQLGEFGEYEGKKVPLDLIMEEIEKTADSETVLEAGKKTPELNKPKRGGSKKFYVYVRDPKTKNIKKVSFGDTSGLSAKINNPKARKAFADRHDCKNKKDKTKAGYWACRLPRYAKLLGLKGSYSGFW